MTPFDILNDIPRKKIHTKENVEKYLDINLLIKFLSNNATGLSIAKYLNENYNMKIWDMYLFAFYILPHSIKSIKYNKREKVVKCDDYEYVMEYYNCSYEVAERYYKLMSDKEFKRIKAIAQHKRKEKESSLV